MALGRKGRNVNNVTHELDPNSTAKEDSQFYDAENNGENGGRKMSRIAGVMGGESDQDSQMGVGKQLELEATNSIKYRTCSWQKVIQSFNHPRSSWYLKRPNGPRRNSLSNAETTCHFLFVRGH